MLLFFVFSLSFFSFLTIISASVPNVKLGNTAISGLFMPAIGLGTGGYSNNISVGYNGYPECWSSLAGCGPYAQRAVETWIKAGGRRIDAANSYQNQKDVGIGMASSGVPREELFLLSKVGPSNPLGYVDTLNQFEQILTDMNTSYVDTLLIHWPVQTPSQGNVSHNNSHDSSDPFCNFTSDQYNEKSCRISTWQAMVEIFKSGRAKSIGVSNYNVTHIQEIIDAGLPLPSVNQIPFHIYRSSTQMDISMFCALHGITVLSYSPFGVPDWHLYPTPALPAANQLQHPLVKAIAKHNNVTPAQVLIQWIWALGMPCNPRTMSLQHMQENLAAYSFGLNSTEIHLLSSQPQVWCSVDPYYECAV